MKGIVATIFGVAALLAAGQSLAQLTFYEREGLRGRSFDVDWELPNFEPYGFNDRASSVVVHRGSWQVCEDANFRGYCTVLRPGQYPSLGSVGLNNKVSSVRRVRGAAPAPYLPPPPNPTPYAYYPRPDERLYEAQVVAVRAVVGPGEQRCWIEHEYVDRDRGSEVGGAVIGGILGGVLGHQIGGGRGNDVATALGAIGGAAVGANAGRRQGDGYTQEIRRCSVRPGSSQPQYWDVTYVFRGREHRTQLSVPPGPTITVNGMGQPRM